VPILALRLETEVLGLSRGQAGAGSRERPASSRPHDSPVPVGLPARSPALAGRICLGHVRGAAARPLPGRESLALVIAQQIQLRCVSERRAMKFSLMRLDDALGRRDEG
jgi:hypothetical protein